MGLVIKDNGVGTMGLTLASACVIETHCKLRPQSVCLIVKLVQRRISADVSTIGIVLRLLQGLCKGHYHVRLSKVHIIVR